MSYQTLLVDDFAAKVVTITLNRPERLNAMNQLLIDELRDTCEKLTAAPPKVLVITGAGRGFCAGADLLSSTFNEPGDRATSWRPAWSTTSTPACWRSPVSPAPRSRRSTAWRRAAGPASRFMRTW